MREKMKTISRKAAFILLAFLIFAAVPAKSAEAKAIPDISKVINKNVSQVAKYLKIEKFKYAYSGSVSYNKPKKGDKDRKAISLYSSKPKKKGKWSIEIWTNKVSVYGANISMPFNQIHSILTKKGWKGGLNDYYMGIYEDSKHKHEIIVYVDTNYKAQCIDYHLL